MINVYLDSNIFRFLKKNDETQFQQLNNKLIQYSGSPLFYCYSHAHLLDLKQDLTNKKEEDLKFMETIVNDNYLCLYWGEKTAKIYPKSPTEAFNEIEDDSDLSTLNPLSFFEEDPTDDPVLNSLKKSFKTILDATALDLSYLNLDNMSSEDKKMIEKLIPIDKNKPNLVDILKHISTFNQDLFNNQSSTYKDMRGYLVQGMDLKKHNIDYNNINFNEDLKNTAMGKTFVEFVTNSINPDGTKEITLDNFFINAFTSLNLLGIDKEKNRKARFANTFNDAQHGYYGAYCDYVVSDDETFLRKCKVMYKLLGFETKVLHIDEFCDLIDSIADGGLPKLD
jgi:hypothetical protein